MIDAIRDLGMHPDRVKDEQKRLQECMEVYERQFEKAVRQVQVQASNMRALERKLAAIDLYLKQE